jgi:hypothetical protein
VMRTPLNRHLDFELQPLKTTATGVLNVLNC